MKKILLILGIVIVIIILFITISRIIFDKKVTKEIDDMLTEDGSKTQSKTFSFNDLEGLPEPVQRYFKYVLKDGQEHIKFVRLKQIGLSGDGPLTRF